MKKLIDEVKDSIEENSLDHEFIYLKDVGQPTTTQNWCNDCQFLATFEDTLELRAQKDAPHEKKQTRMICKQCSFYYRGPSLYAVCSHCAELYEDRAELDDGVINDHTNIYYQYEKDVSKKRKLEKMFKK
jgi:hypothetical protein